ncbi:coenzyme F420-dependent N5,N10-methylene tetrahydromethanopterin reductase [Klebsiella michiganensis]|uniref:Coenzyme F420-dependent N5,N10-methylene tetrahydromethanopterin reductase n=1 Tax=Klebsiella michiganensis TaxID=1134687 RepID=A0A7H4N0L2_9ENTR|nr:coenzyme F420-dependent N5,N10-methylene tetrahydromethanopterin reductase [Klebsiella michiganensis]
MTQKADDNINILAFSRRRLLSQSNLSGESEEWPGDYRQGTLRQRFLHHLRSYWGCVSLSESATGGRSCCRHCRRTLATLGFSLSADVPSPDFFPFYPFH